MPRISTSCAASKQPFEIKVGMIDRMHDCLARDFPREYQACKTLDPSSSLKPMLKKLLEAALGQAQD